MMETIQQRVTIATDYLELQNAKRVVPMSATKNWNIYALLTAMVDAAGDSKGAGLLRAVHPSSQEGDGKSMDVELGKRFGISPALRSHFRSVLME